MSYSLSIWSILVEYGVSVLVICTSLTVVDVVTTVFVTDVVVTGVPFVVTVELSL